MMLRTLRADKRRTFKARILSCEQLESRQLLAVVMNLNDSGAGSLRNAIATEPAGGTITFNLSGTITLATELVVNKALTIDGTGQNIAISGNNATRVMRIEDATPATFTNVTLKSIIIENGRSVTDGAGIQSFENLTLDGVTVRNNLVTGAPGNYGQDAGGIAQGGETKAGGNLTIMNSTIEFNTAVDDAGAIDHYNSNDLTITNTVIRSNVSGGVNNDANQAGYVGPIRVIDAVTAALYTDETISFDGVTFENNKTAVYADFLTAGGTTAGSAIGGVLISAPTGSNWTADVRNSTFSGNFQEITAVDPVAFPPGNGRGTSLYFNDVANVNVQNSTFRDSYSYSDGGGMIIANAYNNVMATLDQVTITGNGDGAGFGLPGVTAEAGGLWVIKFTTTTINPSTLDVAISNSTISNNRAATGGGMQIRQGATVTITDSVISGNSATNLGGGIDSRGNFAASAYANSLSLNRVTVDSNTAGYNGGGINFVNVAGQSTVQTLSVLDSTISRNSVAGVIPAPISHPVISPVEEFASTDKTWAIPS